MKLCRWCNTSRANDNFYVSNPNKCKPCNIEAATRRHEIYRGARREANRKYYAANKVQIRLRVFRRAMDKAEGLKDIL